MDHKEKGRKESGINIDLNVRQKKDEKKQRR
jgi:hypothetical protein